MKLWFTLWLLAAVLEAVSYTTITKRSNQLLWVRILVFGLVGMVTLLTTVVLVVSLPSIWLLPGLLGVYRLFLLARALYRRLQADHLRTSNLRAFGGIFITQLLFAWLFWSIDRHGWGMNALIVLAATQLLVALVLLRTTLNTWSGTAFAHKHIPALTDKQLPTLSVLIPARNETDALQACLQSLVLSDYPKLEIIALDDCSSDRRTPEIIRQFAHDGVRFVQGAEVDERWLAKTFAYHRLSQESTGELMLFCGVDVLVEPQTLRRLVEVLIEEKRDMLSVLPQRLPEEKRRVSLIQPMRYYWEVCFPRRLFKRPPVLSTSWLIRRQAFEDYGGLAGLSHAVTPEAHLAKKAVVSDAYMFVRSTAELPLYSTKTIEAQYDTMIRVRYPQLHKRPEMVMLAAVFELAFMVGPFLGLIASFFLPYSMAFVLLWLTAALSVVVMYCLVAVQTRLNTPLVGLVSAPVAFLVDFVMLHNSMLKYEFGKVVWKERNICLPVLRVYPSLPPMDDKQSATSRS